MKLRTSIQFIIAVIFLSTLSVLPINAQKEDETFVRCERGESINATLAKLNRRADNLVIVSGMCTETVSVRDHTNLAIVGEPGAVLIPDPEIDQAVIVGVAYRFVLSGFTINGSGQTTGVNVGQCLDCRLQGNTLNGVGTGIIATSVSNVAINNTTINASQTGINVTQLSKVVISRTVIEHSGTAGGTGLSVTGNSFARVDTGSTFRGFGTGLSAVDGGAIFLFGSTNMNDPNFIRIENNQSSGAFCGKGGILNFRGRISVTENGGSGPFSGGIVVENGGTLSVGGLGASPLAAEITNNQGHGILLMNSSVGDLAGPSITNNGRGLTVLNSTTLELRGVTVSGSTMTDVLCDSTGTITGWASATGATTVQCSNLKAGRSDVLP